MLQKLLNEQRKERPSAQKLGCADRVFFLGNQQPDAVALWMNAAHCLCLPSRSEGMPNVVIEALASGCPVVATDVGDVRYLVRDGENGYVVSNGENTVSELSGALREALSQTWNAESISSTVAHLS